MQEVYSTPRLGKNLNKSEYHLGLDPHSLFRFIQANELVVLNTWTMKDPCTNYTRTGNFQIDFAASADQRAKQVQKTEAPFGVWKQMTHSALVADVRIIRHFHLPDPIRNKPLLTRLVTSMAEVSALLPQTLRSARAEAIGIGVRKCKASFQAGKKRSPTCMGKETPHLLCSYRYVRCGKNARTKSVGHSVRQKSRWIVLVLQQLSEMSFV